MFFHAEKYQPFTVDDFPRVSSEFDEQSDAVFQNPDIQLRGPSAMFLFRTFNDPLIEKHKHFFGSQYQLYDESEGIYIFIKKRLISIVAYSY